ncbi:MAG: hypothetical protein WBG90_01865 [Saonia sp.]
MRKNYHFPGGLLWFTDPVKKVNLGQLVILRTNIDSNKASQHVQNTLLLHPDVQGVTIDIADCDCVLRMETNGNIKENEVIKMIRNLGFECENLDD